MKFITILIYTTLVAMCIFDIYLFIKQIEYLYCANIKHQPPLVASPNKLRQSVINEILSNYPDARNICELGSGFGGMARIIARKTNANVYALENMPFSAFISSALDWLTKCKNNHTIWCDAFKYLDCTDKKFDIAIAYLGPWATPLIANYHNKIHVLISLDFEIPKIKPKRVIKLKHGYTIYNKKKYPHRLFVYEFK